mmetsp:Transcript_3048/g.7473  ORF Transcript_3048/g.7473 Transcript_3048/m.7473 type:complete len:298 (+) Transcript_3048:1736-2629(+)
MCTSGGGRVDSVTGPASASAPASAPPGGLVFLPGRPGRLAALLARRKAFPAMGGTAAAVGGGDAEAGGRDAPAAAVAAMTSAITLAAARSLAAVSVDARAACISDSSLVCRAVASCRRCTAATVACCSSSAMSTAVCSSENSLLLFSTAIAATSASARATATSILWLSTSASSAAAEKARPPSASASAASAEKALTIGSVLRTSSNAARRLCGSSASIGSTGGSWSSKATTASRCALIVAGVGAKAGAASSLRAGTTITVMSPSSLPPPLGATLLSETEGEGGRTIVTPPRHPQKGK